MTGILNVDQIANSAGTGAVNFPFGIVGNSSPNITANDSNVVFTSTSNPFQVCTPTASRTYTMPASLTAGVQWTFVNKSTTDGDYITLQTSGSNTIAVVPPLSTVTIMPISATPTTAAGWILIGRTSSLVAYTPTFSSGFGTVTAISAYYSVIRDQLKIIGGGIIGTTTSTGGSISIPSLFTMSTISPVSSNLVGICACESASAGQIDLLLSIPGTSQTLVFTGPQLSAANILQTTGPSTIFTNGAVFSFNFTVTILF